MSTPTRYSYTHTLAVAYGWGALTLGALLQSLTTIALIARGHHLPGESLGKSARATALTAGLIASPWLTAHELDATHLILRQGLNFHGRIAYGNIAAVYATERKPTHFPIATYRHTLFVALWPANLVAIRLRRSQRFRLLHVLPLWRVREVVINVDRREAFIADVRARVAAAPADDASRQ